MKWAFMLLVMLLVGLAALGLIAVYVWPFDYLTRAERLSAMEVIVGAAGFGGAIVGLYLAAREFEKAQQRPQPTIALRANTLESECELLIGIGNQGNAPIRWFSIVVMLHAQEAFLVLAPKGPQWTWIQPFGGPGHAATTHNLSICLPRGRNHL
jgi:hypothetical protein